MALIFIFGCYISTRYLADAVDGQLSGATVLLLILLRAAIALEVLLPTTLYLAVVITLGRLYRDAEMTAMFACGISMAQVTKAVVFASVLVSVSVACFSFYIRPWAWDRFYEEKAKSKANFDMTRMKGGKFYEIENGKRVIFAANVNNHNNSAKRVFIRTKRDDRVQIITAKQVRQYFADGSKEIILSFTDGHLYELYLTAQMDRVSGFKNSEMRLAPKNVTQPKGKVKAVPTNQLMASDRKENIAELQWRLFAPLATILLGLLGVPLSRSVPRRGKYANVPGAILIFAVYYNLGAMTKKWVGQGVINSMPGMLWVQFLMAGVVVLFWWRPKWLFR